MLNIRLKLMGALKEKTPPDEVLELEDGSCIEDVLERLGIESESVQIVMVNSKPQPDRTLPLTDYDELTILAPVGGG